MSVALPSSTGRIDLGFLLREPWNVYHAQGADHLTSHALRDFRLCPLLYRHKQVGRITDKDDKALPIGRATHVLALEGRSRYQGEFVVGPPLNPKTGKPPRSNSKVYKEWARKQTRTVLSHSESATVEQAAAAVHAHLFARELFTEGIGEGVVRCDYAGHRCQARLDWINPLPGRGIVDLKTCAEIDTLEAAARALGYIHQLAFYRVLVARVSGRILPAYLVAVEKREPFRCGVWQVAPRALDEAQVENERAMRDLKGCRETGNWFTRFEGIRLIERL